MAERLNDDQLLSLREQIKRRALQYDREVSNMLTTGDADNPLVQRRLLQAEKLRNIAYGIGVVLGDASYNIDFGSGEVEEFNPDINVFMVPEAEWWRSFRTKVEDKQMYPNKPEHLQGPHQIPGGGE